MSSNRLTYIFEVGFEYCNCSFGMFLQSPEEGVKEALQCAIEAGYRHIDCARAYLNEASIGVTLQEQISRGVLKREDIFITSKVIMYSIFLNMLKSIFGASNISIN